MFWAHSDPNNLGEFDEGARWQPLAQHLREVARLAQLLARAARPLDTEFQQLAHATGMLHDVGKYSDSFQRLIRGEIQRDPGGHAARGSALAWLRRQCGPAAFAIVGHHSGIPNADDGATSLVQRSQDAGPQADLLWPAALLDCPEIARALESLPQCARTKGLDLRTRMLFSCLVDADRLDSASRGLSMETLRPQERLLALQKYIALRASQVPEGAVKSVRADVLKSCLAAGAFPENLLSLSVPTGGGKTLASLALALQRAIDQPDKVRRVIVVIPYLSIIEQNAQVFADALGPGSVLEHHSGNFERLKLQDDRFVLDHNSTDKEYQPAWRNLATENWDAPIVVTTSVRFFESLFSNRPSDLRRFHNVARSVVILDEVQTLPRKFLHPMLSAMHGLAKDWDTTLVFCTATQPAFEKSQRSEKHDPRWKPGTVREVIRNSQEHFQTLRRVAVDWNLKDPLLWPELARRLLASRQALAIVNTRQHAVELFRELQAQASVALPIFHLSTRMCAAHRLAKLAEIRALLKAGDPCIVASTQLIEAGVDLDFPVVYRALAPLDSMVQAAGRCDREGRLTAQLGGQPGGKLTIFLTADGKTPPHEYKEATQITAAMANERPLSIDDLNVMRRYFHRYYGETSATALGAEVEIARDEARFRDVADQFRMVADYTQDVFVPWDDQARTLIQQLDATQKLTPELRHGLQRYVVGLLPREVPKAYAAAAIRQIQNTDFWVCLGHAYTDALGVTIEPNAGSMVI